MTEKYGKTAALTGGIASGKSTVSRMFQQLEAHVLDADRVARQIVEPDQPAWQEIVAYFGSEILHPNRQLDRKKLGSVIFHHPDARQRLNQMTHPRVIAELGRQEQRYRSLHPETLILVDVPLLIETSMHSNYATVILVYVPEPVQLKRLMDRDRLSEDEASARIRSQMPLSEKLAYATHLIHNEESLDNTWQQVISVYQTITLK